jgi:hypothetical protein
MNTNTTWVTWALAGIGIILFIWGVVAYRAAAPTGPEVMPTTIADPSSLPGLQTGSAPWHRGLEGLAERMAANSLPQLTMEGQVMHIHQHLDIFINGQAVPVPKDIGINEAAGWLSQIHAHDNVGVIHVESPYVATFTLGQFFDLWGVKFAQDTIGGYVVDDTNLLRMYVNGELYTGDYRTFELGERQQITIVYGTEAQTPAVIPSSYTFPAGY